VTTVIGLAAKPGAGKGTVQNLISEMVRAFLGDVVIEYPRFSDYPREELARRGIPATRDAMQKFVQDLEKGAVAHGEKPGALSREVRKRIKKMKTAEIVIVDGVRWLTDEKMIRSFPNNFLIYVQADARVRFERIKKRAQNPGDAQKTWGEFLAEDSAPNEQYIEDIGARADVLIDNNGSEKALEDQVLHFVLSTICSKIFKA